MSKVERSERAKRWAYTALRIVASTGARLFVVALIALIDPFEAVQWTNNRSHEIWERIQAPMFTNADKSARDAVSIVYLDSSTLSGTGFSLPLTLRNHEFILDDVVNGAGSGPRPVAVFVDLLLGNAAPKGSSRDALLAFSPTQASTCDRAPASDPTRPAFQCFILKVATLTHYQTWSPNPRCQSSTLDKIACIQQAGGVPIFFANAGTPTAMAADPGLSILGEIAAVVPATVSLDGYDLVDPPTTELRAHRPFELTPAAALYAAYCLAGEPCRTSPVAKAGSALDWKKGFEPPVDVAWRVGAPDDFTRKTLDHLHVGDLNQRCEVQNGGRGAWRVFLRALFSGIHLERQRPVCPSTHALPYADLQEIGFTTADADRTLAGKLVLIGGQFDTTNDWVNAAPFGQIPGVYYHAMALGNLIADNQAYPKVSSKLWPFNLTVLDAQNFVVIAAIFFWSAVIKVFMNEPPFDPTGQLRSNSISEGAHKRRPPDGPQARWISRLALFTVWALIICALLKFAEPSGLWRFNTVVIVLVVLASGVELCLELCRPLAEMRRVHAPWLERFMRFFDIADARWDGPDLERRPLRIRSTKGRPEAAQDDMIVMMVEE